MNPDQLGPLGSVPVTITVTLNCGSVPVERAASFEEGSIVRSKRPAGDNFDLEAGGKLIGYGEVVVIEGVMGIRITQIRENE